MNSTKAAHEQARAGKPRVLAIEEQFLILIDCRDEAEQVRLLERLQQEGISCRALLS